MLHTRLHSTYRGKKIPSVPQAGLLDAGELPPSLPCTPHCCVPLTAVYPSLPCTPHCPVPLAAHPASAGSLPHPAGEQPAQRGAHNQGLSKLIVSTLRCLQKA